MEMKPKRVKWGNKLLIAKSYLLDNPHATTRDVKLATGVSTKTVANARRFLREQGVLPLNSHDHKSSGNLTVSDPQSVEDVRAEIDKALNPKSFGGTATQLIELIETETGGIDLKPEEELRILSKIIRDDGNAPQVRTQAILAKRKIEYETQDRDKLGPGPPRTRVEILDRVGLMMKGVGLALVLEALEITFNLGAKNAKEATSSEVSPERTEETPSPADDEGQTPEA